MSAKKTIAITISEGSVARNILYSFVLEKLLADESVGIVLLVLAREASWYEKEFGSARVKIAGIAPRARTILKQAVFYLARNGFRTETILTDQRTRLGENHDYMSFFIKRAIAYALGRSALFHAAVRKFARMRTISGDMAKILLEIKPDMLFATDVQDELDIDAMAAARNLGIRIIGMVRSWDNLTSSAGLIQIVPDMLLVWNQFLYTKAVTLQHVPAEDVRIVGIPQYDWYAQKDIFLSREKFLSQFGIPGDHKIILFAGEGSYYAPYELECVRILSRAIDQGEIESNTSIVFRPHPGYAREGRSAGELAHVVFDERVVEHIGAGRVDWMMNQKTTAHLANSLYHADVVVTTASTMMIDAAAFDKPVVSIAFDGEHEEPYWKSVRRLYTGYTHIHALAQTGGIKIARTPDDLLRYTDEYLKNPRRDEDGRKAIVRDFIAYQDGRSAQRIAETILSFI